MDKIITHRKDTGSKSENKNIEKYAFCTISILVERITGSMYKY